MSKDKVSEPRRTLDKMAARNKREIIYAVISIFLVPVSLLTNGAVAAQLWEWHVVSIGLPPISIGWAIAAIVLSRLVSTPVQQWTREERMIKLLARSIAATFLNPGLALLIGWALT
jgi:hypothetical protein